MQRIYQAANNVEAHMIVHLLGQAGITAHVQGEHLQSGVGELPAAGLVAVAVADDADAPEAVRIVREWERSNPPDAKAATPVPSSRNALIAFAVGALLSGAAVWSLYNGPTNEDTIDFDNDGTPDERLFYKGSVLERIETDRNFDRKVDTVVEFDRRGLPMRRRSDDDFDGRMENTVRYRNAEPLLAETDRNGDGVVDYRERYVDGVIESAEYVSNDTGKVVKRVHFRGARAVSAELDHDGDGNFEQSYEFDLYDEPRP